MHHKTGRRVFLVTGDLFALAIREKGRDYFSLGKGKREKIKICLPALLFRWY